MKKKMILGACFCMVVFFIILSILITNGTGIKKYYSNTIQSIIEIPKYSYFVNELQGDDTCQLEFIMFGKEDHIVEQLHKLYDIDNNSINGYKFTQWSVNDEKIYKIAVILYEKQ